MKIVTLVRADRMRLAGIFSSNEETRYYLNGVFCHTIEDGSVNVVGTDGHRIAIFNEDHGFCNEDMIVKLPKEAIAAIKKTKRIYQDVWIGISDQGTHSRRMAFVLDAGKLDDKSPQLIAEAMQDIAHDGMVWLGLVNIIDGTFPDYRLMAKKFLVDNILSCHPRMIQARYIQDYAQVADVSDLYGSPMSFKYGPEEASPVSVVIDGRPDFFGLVMPIRSENPFKAPRWAFPKDPKRATKKKSKQMEAA